VYAALGIFSAVWIVALVAGTLMVTASFNAAARLFDGIPVEMTAPGSRTR
jgi:hypothetical protein